MPESAVSEIETTNLDNPALYLNRDLSLIEFQRRVLEEAQNPENALLERFKFLSILFSNLDEFFMVRVARLQQQVEEQSIDPGPDGMPPSVVLEIIRSRINQLLDEAYDLFNGNLMPSLKAAGIHILRYNELNEAQKKAAAEYFHSTVFPILTPLAFDPGRPFPHISNLSLSIGVVVKKPHIPEHFARVKVPTTLDQFVHFEDGSGTGGQECLVWLDEVIKANIQSLFPGMEIRAAFPFHVTRDAEVAIQDLESDDLLETIEQAVLSRRFRDVVRLQVQSDMPPSILEVLTANLKVTEAELYLVNGVIDLGRLKFLDVNRPDLKDPAFVPAASEAKSIAKEDIFARISRGSILLHHPYQSFQPVVEFFRQAAHDPEVLAIKTTLYRVGRNSPIVQALLDAALNGKQVAALVELKARFDEESNISWARALESQGVHVVYGLVGLKVHSKISMVVRREGKQMRRYLHLGTGNYNAGTARLYTDFGFFTNDDDLGADAVDLFNHLTGYTADNHFRKLLVAPITMRTQLTELIEREIEHQRNGEQGYLFFKMNSLEDPGMMQLLYRASRAGVKVDLLVRGLCCLRPGLPGLSENIRVISVVGRYLEHSRAYYFGNGGREELYLGSADLMPRNLNRRIEVLFPVENHKMLRHIKEDILDVYLRDRAQARYLRPDGAYIHARAEGENPPFSAQSWFMEKYSASGALRA